MCTYTPFAPAYLGKGTRNGAFNSYMELLQDEINKAVGNKREEGREMRSQLTRGVHQPSPNQHETNPVEKDSPRGAALFRCNSCGGGGGGGGGGRLIGLSPCYGPCHEIVEFAGLHVDPACDA